MCDSATGLAHVFTSVAIEMLCETIDCLFEIHTDTPDPG